ncbi:hypothetical protein [uncultured Sphingobacterium sp.]|uniref:hypothetical protein n=1 Tax=uncultured Sphingobacterium sp. TaxID=182688 RepID=UPI0037496668
MKFTKILVLLFLFIDFSVGFAQKKITVKTAKEYWFSDRLSDSLSEKKIPDPSQGFPIQAFLLQKDRLYYQPAIGDDLIPVSLTPVKGSDKLYLNIGETMTSNHMSDYSSDGKDFLLTKRANEMLLTVNDKSGNTVESIKFIRPTDFMMNKDVSEIYFAHLINGTYRLGDSNDEVSFDMDGNLKWINGFSKWNVIRAAGKIKPRVNSPHAFIVLQTSGVKQKESFVVIFDELIKTMNFFKYNILKDGSYSLEKEPYYILKQR